MFGIGRRSRGELFKAEMGESLIHLSQAATHAAAGVGAAVGPRVTAARAVMSPTAARIGRMAIGGAGAAATVLVPLGAAAMDGARQAGKIAVKAKTHKMRKEMRRRARSRRRSTLTGIMVVGAAIGAAGAMARRRRARQWEEYDADRALNAVRPSEAMVGYSPDETLRPPSGSAPPSSEQSGMDKMKSKAAGAAEKGAERAAGAAEKGAEKAGGSAQKGAERATSATKSAAESAKQSAGKSSR